MKIMLNLSEILSLLGPSSSAYCFSLEFELLPEYLTNRQFNFSEDTDMPMLVLAISIVVISVLIIDVTSLTDTNYYGDAVLPVVADSPGD